ncbi:MAG TPA: DNA mismatch repair protein MutS [Aggregatilineales bacterium]|nr:DNA mismatch repair protein MutS [Aggregatilineales bacterium]
MLNDDLTPMRQQYLDIKAQYPDAIVLFRLGDFYETFDHDAEIASRELDIVLTHRAGGTKGKSENQPMAGIPYHAVEGYVSRLIEKGYHVVIADQMEPPGKKLVRREVTRVITPGTIVEPGMLDQRQNNYLLALTPEADRRGESWARVGLAYVDITTGEFAATQLNSDTREAAVAVLEELARLRPREVLIPALWAQHSLTLPEGMHPTSQPDHRFEAGNARRVLLDHFQVTTLDGYGLTADLSLAVRSAGAIVQYLQDTQRTSLPQLTSIHAYSTASFMVLDAITRRNLELTETIRTGRVKGSLLGVLDRTVTPMGGRLLRTWINQPLLEIGRLQARQDAVQALFDDGFLRAAVVEALKPISDLERLTNRVLSAIAGPRDLLAMRTSLEGISPLRQAIVGVEALTSLNERLDPCFEVVEAIAAAIDENTPGLIGDRAGVIRPGYSPERDEIEDNTRHAKDWIAALESAERERTGIKSLKVGFNKVFGYYIEVSHANTIKVPADYIRKQTLVNAERYITPELKEYEATVLNAEERMIDLETRLFKELCEQIAACGERLIRTARAVAYLDVFTAMAEVAAHEGYCRPELTTDDVLTIQDGRHPVVEKLLEGERYVPNDAHFDPSQRIHILTGPNMSGKSTAIRQVAIIALMAQIGSFVPASAARIGLVDRIFTRIGAQDEIHSGQSTFMVEMTETAALLSCATPRSLLILDEIGRGTSTYDGLAIARAVVEYIHNNPRLNCKTLFATHYHELTELEKILPRVRNYNVSVVEDGEHVVFLHKVVPGGTDRSYGVHVAQLAGMPKALVNRANDILKELESQGSDFAIRRRAQLALFSDEPHPAVTALKALRVEEMSPLEAIAKLYELQRLAREG